MPENRVRLGITVFWFIIPLLVAFTTLGWGSIRFDYLAISFIPVVLSGLVENQLKRKKRNNKKVTLIQNVLKVSSEEGIGNYVFNVSRKLIERDHNVTIITRGSLSRTRREIVNGIEAFKTRFIPIYPFHVHLHGVFVKKQIKMLEFDIIHIHTPLSPPIKASLPIVNTIHSSLLEDACHIEVMDFKSLAIKLQTSSIGHWLVSKLIKNSDLTTTVSRAVSHELRKYYGVDAEPIVIGSGVDEKTFAPAKSKSRENYVLYVGRLSYGKGLFDLLKCAKILAKSNISFVLVGKGELEKKLKEKVKDAGLQDKTIFMGQVDREKLIRLYQNAILVTIPSHYESGPLVLLEAMSCGKPVVSTRVGIAQEIIKNLENGILIPPKSPEKMAESISILVEDEKLRGKLGKNARKTIGEMYTWDSVTDRLEDCYRSLRDYR